MKNVDYINPQKLERALLEAAVAGITEVGAMLALVAMQSGLLQEREALRIVGPRYLAKAGREVA